MNARPLLPLIALLALAACNRERDKAETPAPAPDAAPAVRTGEAAPLAFQQETPDAKVALSLPASLTAHPDLHVRLYAEEMKRLREFQQGAQADRTEAGAEDLPVYEKTIAWRLGAETGKLFSLVKEDSEYSGGAHPNTVETGLIYDKALKRTVGPGDLFRRGADMNSLDQALCTALNAEKRERNPTALGVTFDSETFRCPRALATPFTLAPSTTGGKAGGLIFLVGPYQVGPYAEGAYQVAIPQGLFRSLLNPAYADEFAGEPRAVG